MPFKWDQFNESVFKLRYDSLNEIKSKIKQDEEFQKEYLEDILLLMEDKIYIKYTFFEIYNRDQLDALYKGIFDSMLNPLIEKLYKNSNQLN